MSTAADVCRRLAKYGEIKASIWRWVEFINYFLLCIDDWIILCYLSISFVCHLFDFKDSYV